MLGLCLTTGRFLRILGRPRFDKSADMVHPLFSMTSRKRRQSNVNAFSFYFGFYFWCDAGCAGQAGA
jgi:hypothetical protein